jgi:hypothetical protein
MIVCHSLLMKPNDAVLIWKPLHEGARSGLDRARSKDHVVRCVENGIGGFLAEEIPAGDAPSARRNEICLELRPAGKYPKLYVICRADRGGIAIGGHEDTHRSERASVDRSEETEEFLYPPARGHDDRDFSHPHIFLGVTLLVEIGRAGLRRRREAWKCSITGLPAERMRSKICEYPAGSGKTGHSGCRVRSSWSVFCSHVPGIAAVSAIQASIIANVSSVLRKNTVFVSNSLPAR